MRMRIFYCAVIPLLAASCATQERRAKPGDILDVSVFELVTPGETFEKRFPVDASGMIKIPNIKPLKVSGLTRAEVEDALFHAMCDGVVGLQPGEGPETHVTFAN